MAKLPQLVPITDLRQDASEVLKRLRASNEPIIITQRGRAAAVLVSIDAFEQTENKKRLLESLLRGEQEIASGEGHDLDDVLRDADVLLKKEPVES